MISVSIFATGPSTVRHSTPLVTSSTVGPFPDYVVLEQSYLDPYVLKYNILRTATPSAYIPHVGPLNVESSNPSYGLLGPNSPA